MMPSSPARRATSDQRFLPKRLMGQNRSPAPRGTSGHVLVALPPSMACSIQEPLFSGMNVAGNTLGLEGSSDWTTQNTDRLLRVKFRGSYPRRVLACQLLTIKATINQPWQHSMHPDAGARCDVLWGCPAQRGGPKGAIPFGKRKSENCRGGVVRRAIICERASSWRDLDAMLASPHLAYRDGVTISHWVSGKVIGYKDMKAVSEQKANVNSTCEK